MATKIKRLPTPTISPERIEPLTRASLAKEDRKEREYYNSRSDLKNSIRLPVTLDGCEALLEVVTKSLDLPLDDTIRQVFAGFVHHKEQTDITTSLDEVGKVIYKNYVNNVTWTMDQEAKKREQEKAAAARLKAEAEAFAATAATSQDPELNQGDTSHGEASAAPAQ